MRHKLPGILTAAFGLLVSVIPVSAHHGFAVEFDAKKCADFPAPSLVSTGRIRTCISTWM